MPTPKAGYRLTDGTRVPSVTTVLSRYKDSGGLIHWAWQLGADGKDYRQERDKAADVGTLAHAMVEQNIKGLPIAIEGDPEMIGKARSAFNAYLSWADQTKLVILETEMMLVSEKHRFGGTPDAVGQLGNAIVLVDWKSSNSVWPEHLIQLAAYGELLREVRGLDIQGYHLCRFSKEHGDFAHHYFQDLTQEWEAFTLMRRLYELDKSIKKRAG